MSVQLLGTWKENNDSLAVITHIHTKTKTQGLFYFSLFTPAMNCLVQKDELTCHQFCQLFSHLWSSKTQGRMALDHVLVAPACFYKWYCSLESSLCHWDAPWGRDSQLHRPSVATNWLCILTLSLQVFSDRASVDALSWCGEESGRNSVWLLLELKSPGQVLPHSVDSIRQPNGSCWNI